MNMGLILGAIHSVVLKGGEGAWKSMQECMLAIIGLMNSTRTPEEKHKITSICREFCNVYQGTPDKRFWEGILFKNNRQVLLLNYSLN